MIAFFILGYSGFIYYLISHYDFAIIHSVIASILLLGGVFVYMVIRISLDNYENTVSIAKRTEYNALHDTLTGLPNRKHFLNVLFKNTNQSTSFTLFSLDLNNFKQVNDALGYYYGDKLLAAIAKRIEKKLANLYTIFRTGGDRFALVLEESDHLGHSDTIDRIHSAFTESYQIMGYSIESSVNIGATKYPEDSTNIDSLLQYANLAVYTSKLTRNRCVFYTQELNKNTTQQLEISGRLREALALKEFDLYFQPIVMASTSKIHGAETLIRWPQADGSFISPEVFIPIAEKSGLIIQITEWVIEEAIANLKRLDEQGFTGCLHVNLSAKDLQSEALFNLLIKKLNNKEVSSQRLVLEITESTMMTDLNRAKNMMFRLAKHGFTFSIDDFGTGFSSLSLLRELPIQQIKIDRSFVHKMDCATTDYAIVKSSIYLAKNLGCSVVAEGIENQRVETALINLNCDYLQGYYYSKPIPLTQFINNYCFNKATKAY